MSNLSHGNELPVWVDQQNFYIPFNIQDGSKVGASGAVFQSYRANTTGFSANVSCTEISPSNEDNQLLFGVDLNGSSIQFSTSHSLVDGTKVTCFGPRGEHVRDPKFETIVEINPFTNGISALEVVEPLSSAANASGGEYCSQALTIGWTRVGAGNISTASNLTTTTNRTTTQTFLSCTQKLLVAQYEVTVNSEGRILNSNRVSDFVSDTTPYFASNSTALIHDETSLFQQSTSLIAPPSPYNFAWHNDSFTSDWMNFLLVTMLNSSSLVDPAFPVPDAVVIAPYVERLYTELFAILLSINTHVFSDSSDPFTAQVLYTDTRLFVSPLMFKLSIVILSLQLFVAILYYANRPKRFLPRMPTSIASIIAFVAASRAVEDFNGSDGRRGEKSDGEEGERRYGYGRFVGTDGRTKVGIERQRFVVPLEVRNPNVKRRGLWTRIRGGDNGEVRSWI